MSGNHRWIFFFSAKSSAGFHLHHTHTISRQVAQFHQSFVNVIRALHGAPDCEPLIDVESGDHPVVFNIELFLSSRRVFTFYDVVGIFPYCIDVILFDQIRFEGVVCSPDDWCVRLAGFYAEDRGKRLVLHGDGLNRCRKQVPVRMSKQQEWFFRVIDHSVGKAWLVIVNQRDAVFARNVLRPDDYKFFPVDC